MSTKKIKKYPDGGTLPTSNSGKMPQTIVMGEEVVPGSARHKELLALEEQKAKYNAQQEYVNSFGVTPKPLTIDQFNNKYKSLDESFVPPTSGTIYNFGKVLPEANASSGLVPFTYGPTGEQFLSGLADPGQVPNYDLVEPDYGDMTLIPEEPYQIPKQTQTPSPYIKQAPGAYYKNEGGQGEFAPKDAVWQEETGTYYDANTGKIYNPRSGAITVDPNWKSTVKENTEIEKPIIQPTLTPSSGTTVKLAGGGKLLQTLGDTAKFTGDTLLSTIGLTDVINDDMYRNQKFADASKVGETVGKYTGQIAANILAPGVGGAVLGTAQKVLGQVDGEDEKRAYTDKLNSLQSQGALGKFNNSAYSTPDYVNPLNATMTGIGEIGTMISGQGVEGMKDQFGNMKQQIQDFNLPAFGCGGSVKKMADGGEFIEYNGPTHAEGGIPIDQNGQPTNKMNAQAEVEGGEAMHDDGIDKYIFSDRLMQDPKSKITFADTSKKINRKYKDLKDPFQKAARELELNRLKQEQEQFKATISQGQNTQQSVQPQMAVGGNIEPKKLQPIPEANYDNFELDYSDPFFNPLGAKTFPDGTVKAMSSPEDYRKYWLENQKYGLLPKTSISKISNDNVKIDSSKKLNPGFDTASPWIGSQEDYNILNPSNNSNYINVENIPAESYPEDNIIYDENGNPYTLPKSYVPETFGSSSNSKPSSNPGGLPQDKINPLGFAASNMGNVYDLFQSAKPAKANNFDKVNLSTLNLEAQREELRKQAGTSTAMNREAARQMATSSGQALGNQIIGNALINSNLGSGLSQSFLNEQNANVQIKNREELTNNQIRQSEIIADQMDQGKRQSTTSGALHSIGMNTQGYTRDLKSAKVGNENNQLWFDAIKTGKYTELGKDAEGNMVIQLHDGRVITKPKQS